MNYILIHSLISSSEERYNFYLFNYYRWLPHSYIQIQEKISGEEIKMEVTRKHQKVFNSVRSWLTPAINRLHIDIQSKPVSNTIRGNWILSTRQIEMEIINCKKDISTTNNLDLNHSIIDSYIHMNNNRLGIKNQDESLISFLILKSLKHIPDES